MENSFWQKLQTCYKMDNRMNKFTEGEKVVEDDQHEADEKKENAVNKQNKRSDALKIMYSFCFVIAIECQLGLTVGLWWLQHSHFSQCCTCIEKSTGPANDQGFLPSHLTGLLGAGYESATLRSQSATAVLSCGLLSHSTEMTITHDSVLL